MHTPKDTSLPFPQMTVFLSSIHWPLQWPLLCIMCNAATWNTMHSQDRRHGTNCQNKKERKGNFFPTKRGKQRIFSFSCENETNKTKHKTFLICFLIYMDLYILFLYRFYCKTDKVYNRQIKFPTFVLFVFFWFFLVHGLTLSLWLSFRISL